MSGEPNIVLTPDEKREFTQLFRQYDGDSTGIVLGDSVRPLFERSGLPAKVLGQIWSYADIDNRGFLDFQGFSKALRMIAHVQRGQPLTSGTYTVPSGTPILDGRGVQTPASPTAGTENNARLSQVGTGTAGASGGTQIPPLSTSDKQRFGALFDKSAQGALIEGPAAKEIFLKARLPNETLGRIWNLVDVQPRGTLTRNEFILAMHLIQCTINRSLLSIPSSLPQAWLPWLESTETGDSHAASRGVAVNTTGGSFGQPIHGDHWVITPQQRAQYDGYFASLDPHNTGVIGAQEVVPFLTKSRLSEEVLAHVWDLADIRGTGQFRKPEFAIAMFLVQAKLANRELPQTLPTELSQSANSQLQAAEPQRETAPKQIPQSSGSLTDLVDLDDAFASQRVSSPALQPQKTQKGPTARAPKQHQQQSIVPRASASVQSNVSGEEQVLRSEQTGGASGGPRSPQAENRSKFIPMSSFGQSLIGQPGTRNETGHQNPDVSREASGADLQNAHNENLRLAKEAETLQGQFSSISLQRKQLDDEFASVLKEKKQLESEIRGLRERYDAEASKVHKTQSLIQSISEEMKQLRKSHSLRESGLKALQTQHEQNRRELDEAQEQKDGFIAQISGLDEQHNSHKTSLESLHSETEHLRGQVDGHQKQIAAMEQELHSVLDQIEAAKLTRDDTAKRAIDARERADRLATELVAAQKEHTVIVSETEKHEHDIKTAGANLHTAPERAIQSPTGPTLRSSAVPAGAAATAAAVAAATASGSAAPAHTSSERAPAYGGVHSPSSTVPGTSTVYSGRSSPATSEFPYHEPVQQIPSFTLPMERPQSATSSVANNPPLSIRGDVDVSQPDSPDLPTSEPVSGLVPPETMKLSHPSEGPPRLASDTDSFEFVDAFEGRDAELMSQSRPGVPQSAGLAAADTRAASQQERVLGTQVPLNKANEEFPPIRDLDIERESSDDEPGPHPIISRHDQAHLPSALPPQPSALPPQAGYAGERRDVDYGAANTRGVPNDEFGDEFDDLQEAQEDTYASEEDDFSGFGNVQPQHQHQQLAGNAQPQHQHQQLAQASEPHPSASRGTANPAGPDEWQKLFADTAPAIDSPARRVPGTGPANTTTVPGAALTDQESAPLQELTAMGFDRDSALAALKRANYNVSEATDYLLDA